MHPATLGLPHEEVPRPVSVMNSVGVRVPAAPMLDPNDSAERKAYLLSRWYVGAVESRTGKRCYAFSRGPISKSKHFDTLVKAAELFIAQDIAPAAWCAFSIDVWREHNQKVPPPIRWVFSETRITGRADWFHSEAENWNAGRVFLTAAGKSLLRRQALMRRDLAFVGANDAAGTRRVVDQYFPGDSFSRLLNRARKEAHDAELDIRSRVSAGEWVW